jgi:hypothetical protein
MQYPCQIIIDLYNNCTNNELVENYKIAASVSHNPGMPIGERDSAREHCSAISLIAKRGGISISELIDNRASS